MSKLNKFIGFLPPIFVILISAAAFVPGILQSDVTEIVERTNVELENARTTYDFMVEQANFVFEYDSDIYNQMWDKLQANKELEVEWMTLGSNATLLQNHTFANLMMMNFGVANVLADQTFSFSIDTDLHNNPTQESYEIGVSSTGQAFEIQRVDWISHPIFLRTTLGDFITETYAEWYSGGEGGAFFQNSTMDFLLDHYSDDLDSTFHFLFANDTIFTLDRRCNLYFLTQIPLFTQIEYINSLINVVKDAETLVADYSTIISVTTVATLLATAMAGRMEERKINHKVSLMRADLKNDENLIVGEVDKFSLLILTLALLIALGALIFILWI